MYNRYNRFIFCVVFLSFSLLEITNFLEECFSGEINNVSSKSSINEKKEKTATELKIDEMAKAIEKSELINEKETLEKQLAEVEKKVETFYNLYKKDKEAFLGKKKELKKLEREYINIKRKIEKIEKEINE